MKKKIGFALQLFLVIGIAVVTLVLMFRGKEAGQIRQCLTHAKKGWVLAGAFLMIVFVFLEAVLLKTMFNGMKQKVSLWKCFLLSNVEYFFAQLTPGAAGGQPVQMLYMGSLGIDVLVGALACMMITVLYKTTFLVIFLAALIFRNRLVVDAVSQVPFLFTFGILFQLASISFLFSCVFFPSWAMKLVNGIINIGAKLHIVKDPDKTKAGISNSIRLYRKSSEFLKTHKLVILRMFIITLVQRLSFFSVTFCVAKALGVQHVNWFSVVSVQTILSLSVDALPIPGAAGANELVFVNLQKTLFSPELMATGLLLNRGITYYFLLVCSGIFTILLNVIPKKRKERHPVEAEENGA